MGVFRWIGRFIAWLWSSSRRSWVSVGLGLRPRSPASGLVLFLFLIFFLVGLILVLLGFDLGAVDLWLDAQSSWLDAVASLLFRALCGLILLGCVFVVGAALFGRKGPDRPGWGYVTIALITGYFTWFGVTG